MPPAGGWERAASDRCAAWPRGHTARSHAVAAASQCLLPSRPSCSVPLPVDPRSRRAAARPSPAQVFLGTRSQKSRSAKDNKPVEVGGHTWCGYSFIAIEWILGNDALSGSNGPAHAGQGWIRQLDRPPPPPSHTHTQSAPLHGFPSQPPSLDPAPTSVPPLPLHPPPHSGRPQIRAQHQQRLHPQWPSLRVDGVQVRGHTGRGGGAGEGGKLPVRQRQGEKGAEGVQGGCSRAASLAAHLTSFCFNLPLFTPAAALARCTECPRYTTRGSRASST